MLGRILGRRVQRTDDVPDDVIVRRGRWLPALGGRLAGMGRSAAAVTLGRTIVVHPAVETSGRLLRHELAHVRQWRRQPLTFPVRYLLGHLRYGYRENPYEVEARAQESRGFGSDAGH